MSKEKKTFKKPTEKEMLGLLARIAKGEHSKKCSFGYVPLGECFCWNPEEWVSTLLGVAPTYEDRPQQETDYLNRLMEERDIY